jgi:hypothetical protein
VISAKHLPAVVTCGVRAWKAVIRIGPCRSQLRVNAGGNNAFG